MRGRTALPPYTHRHVDWASPVAQSGIGHTRRVADDEAPERGDGERKSAPPSEERGGFAELRARVPAAIRDVPFPSAARGYERRAVASYVNQVNRLIAELEVGRSPQAAVRRALDRVGEQAKALLQQARETAEEITASAREEQKRRSLAHEPRRNRTSPAQGRQEPRRRRSSPGQGPRRATSSLARGPRRTRSSPAQPPRRRMPSAARARRRRSGCSGSRKRSRPCGNRPKRECKNFTPRPRRSGRSGRSCSTRST